MKSHFAQKIPPGFTPQTLALRDLLAEGRRQKLASGAWGDCALQWLQGDDALWLLVEREGRGGFAWRAAPTDGPIGVSKIAKRGADWAFRIESAIGDFAIAMSLLGDKLMRLTVKLTPTADVLVPFWPRDLYPIDVGRDPTQVKGRVEAAQRGVNTGLCYFCIEQPQFGAVFYMQNLSALNDYFTLTRTKPDGVVGGEWPELGYQPPSAPIGNSPPTRPLPKGQTVTISDAFLAIDGDCDMDEHVSAARFIEALASIYPYLDKPKPLFRDWPMRAQKTLRDLGRSPKASLEYYGARFVRPYTDAEYPDSMVQLSVLNAMAEHARFNNCEPPLFDQLHAGIGRFYDKDLSVIRRYLPNVGDDKDADAVDSWYLYHALMNFARLAGAGDALAHKLFLNSLDFAVRAARHFNYKWPIQYNVKTFGVLTAARDDKGLGQTDVGGIYAYVMLQAHELTGEEEYLNEARAAIRALKGMRFELVYQTNLTAWGAAACIKLWRHDRDDRFLHQAQVFIAGFLHNCEMWESGIERAVHYHNFLGATCLHDGPYIAAYECFDSFAAFDEVLRIGGGELPQSIRLILAEYNRFALDRAWYFYPDALPAHVLSEKVRNGHIDRALSFPLEDIYGDGQPAGQVGQEIYGCGGVFTFETRAFYRLKHAPFVLFCDYPAVIDEVGPGEIALCLLGATNTEARVRVRQLGRRDLPRLSLRTLANGEAIASRSRAKSYRDYVVPGDGQLQLKWTAGQT